MSLISKTVASSLCIIYLFDCSPVEHECNGGHHNDRQTQHNDNDVVEFHAWKCESKQRLIIINGTMTQPNGINGISLIQWWTKYTTWLLESKYRSGIGPL